jgi:hypothetical protein
MSDSAQAARIDYHGRGDLSGQDRMNHLTHHTYALVLAGGRGSRLQ